MKITDIQLKRIDIPLKKTFKTALRTVDVAENIVVVMKADDGTIGYGAAPPTAAITGDTANGKSIIVISRFRPLKLNFVIHQAAIIPKSVFSGTAITATNNVNWMALSASDSVIEAT